MNKSMVALIALIIFGISLGVYANYSSSEQDKAKIFNDDLGMLRINTNICEVENETSWWKNEGDIYCIGNKPIDKKDCFAAGYSICFSRDYVLAMVEIMDDAEVGVGEQ